MVKTCRNLIKRNLAHYWNSFWFWLSTSGFGIFWIGLIVVGVILVIAALLGCVGGIVVGFPALVIYFAFNWVVSEFGGPAITFKMAIGLFILLSIMFAFLHRSK